MNRLRESEISKKFTKFIINKLNGDQLIKSFSLTKKIHGTIFSKSKKGMYYGRHVDNTFMSSGRADLSFTVFLSDIDTYEGGELIIENINF